MNNQIYQTHPVTIGGFAHVEVVTVGGGAPVVIQTMWKDRLAAADLEGSGGGAVVRRIEGLRRLGCRLLRFAVPDMEAADALGRLAGMTAMPICADIHFDYHIALRCLDFPIAKIRINPGNIGGEERVKAVLGKAAEKGVPIRIGVNAGSLPADLRQKFDSGGMSGAQALAAAAEREMEIFDRRGFKNFVVSMKASSVAETIAANRLFASRRPAPLHIGLTEAGPLAAGTVRNTAALVPLLAAGIGDTIRVSLSDTMENEVIAAREILNAAEELAEDDAAASGGGRLGRGVRIVSCPRCGRHGFDTHAFTARWMEKLYAMEARAQIAIMGCAVNGPGEARHADLGVTGAGDEVLIFRRGKVIRTVDAAGADAAFAEELAALPGL